MDDDDIYGVMDDDIIAGDDLNDVIANRTRSRNVRAVMLTLGAVLVFLLIIACLVGAAFYATVFMGGDSGGYDSNDMGADGEDISVSLDMVLDRLSADSISAHIEFLSSDLLEGRGPGTRGEELAVEYIESQLREVPRMEVSRQPVPLFGLTPFNVSSLSLRPEGSDIGPFAFVDDYLVTTDLETDKIHVQADSFVFVGYGIDAEDDWHWNDFKDVNVAGKILVSFVNDPPATEEEPDLFLGETLTYYGRWTYKYEEARRRRAKGIFLIHTLETAGYPYRVLSNGGQGEDVELQSFAQNRLDAKGWLTKNTAEQLAAACGSSLDDWFAMAGSRDFYPIEYDAEFSVSSHFEIREFEGQNVLGVLPGILGNDEAILFSGHHDHLGIGPPDSLGDVIYNGAIDNASGSALVLATAAAFAGTALDRTIVFSTVTAEECGLLGSQYLAENPGWQLIANINYDVVNVYGPTNDLVPVYDPDNPIIFPLVEECTTAEGMTISPDPEPEQGEFFRSDQLSFARTRVPAVLITGGCDYIDQPSDYCQTVRDDYRLNHYHQPSDEFDPDWNLDGVLQQGRVGIRMAYAMAERDFSLVNDDYAVTEVNA